ncbi:amidase domain-containing protein [Paenibacillus xerothermodurans]|uniref:Putative amidase domain-containing protein n=1 Tax=Paenibacillus xerothermodurans TaxID=1977292 RepID=A0A2W1N5T1_PAEXE|nr:amidase domain-containing protein [Paenibacillus xerothermodurans]PZE19737.1 hypothetical protein CBW46_016425 [Paenibacillus xerothermodurans]
MSWKTTLYDYVHHKNQTHMDYSIAPLLPFVTDTNYLQSEIKRLARTAHSDQDRRFVPVKSETRLALIGVSQEPQAITADIKLKRTSVGTISSTEFEQQQLQTERVVLGQLDDKWYVTQIKPLDAEFSTVLDRMNPTESATEQYDSLHDQIFPRLPSQPYLNYNVVPYLESMDRKAYNRNKAVEYADSWWAKGNPAYLEFEVDCTNYVSQCLFAGGAAMNYTGKRDSGWWYKGRYHGQELWSFSWSVAHSLQTYLMHSRNGLRAEAVSRPDQLQLGDVISYDWDGDGRYQHSAVVTAKDSNGMPLVNAHTSHSRHRYWSYVDSPAWTERTQYQFLHIADHV